MDAVTFGFAFCIVALIVVAAFFILLWIDKRGIKMRFGVKNWAPFFSIESSRPEGMTREEAEEMITNKVAEAIDSHLSAMESYKDHCSHYDQNTKTLIAHKLDEVAIPVFAEIDPTQQQILQLTVKMELLVLNIENHYAQAAITEDALRDYLSKRYERLLKIFERFSDDHKANQKSAFFVLKDWWSIICPALSSMIQQKKEINDSAQMIFSDEAWKKRMLEVGVELDQIAIVLDQHSDIYEIIRNYFVECSYDVPTYLE